MPDILLVPVGLLAVICALGVILSRDTVYSALFLTAHLIGVGVLYLALTHQFLAVAQVLVYAGAVMVVFVFAVTTLSPKEDPLKFSEQKGIFGIALVSTLTLFASVTMGFFSASITNFAPTDSAQLQPIQQFALDLFGPYLLPFEATVFLLLVALIGAMILGRKRQDNGQ